MSRAIKQKVEPVVRKPETRIRDFDEVVLGYNLENALREATRCLKCPLNFAPCIKGCPVGVKGSAFIAALASGNVEKALRVIWEDNFFPSITGRVCPQERLCESQCVMGRLGDPVSIGLLERFVGDYSRETGVEKELLEELVSNIRYNGKSVAIVGSGPAGLMASYKLSVLGYKVTLFEALHEPGGVLVYGIPEFRLPKSIVKHEVEKVLALGVELKLNHIIGKTLTLEELRKEYDAVFLATGAGTPKLLDIPGIDLHGVYTANEFLTRVNLMRSYRFPEYDTPIEVGSRTVVIGGGNTAMDAARVALRLGSKVIVAYRRGLEDMLKTARKHEVIHAKEEGVEFAYYLRPVEILGDSNGRVRAVKFEVMEPTGEVDESGKTRIRGKGVFVEIPADTVIIAIGLEPNKILEETTGLRTHEDGRFIVDDHLMTSIEEVFAGGDAVRGEATVIEALADGRKAAEEIHRYLSSL